MSTIPAMLFTYGGVRQPLFNGQGGAERDGQRGAEGNGQGGAARYGQRGARRNRQQGAERDGQRSAERNGQRGAERNEQRGAERKLTPSEHSEDRISSISTTLKSFPIPQTSSHELYNMAGIEEEIDSRLPARIGCPKLPVLPVETRQLHQAIDTYFPNFDYHVGNIGNVLAKYNIAQYGTRFVYRVNPGIDAADRYLTLVIISSFEDGCQDQWVKAVAEIRLSLVQSGIYWAIELIDFEMFYWWPPVIQPILSTDRDLIEGWSKVLPDFLTTIENRNWVAIDVLRRYSPLRRTEPTVIISARDADNDTWWDTTLPALYQLLQANNLDLDIVLLFL